MLSGKVSRVYSTLCTTREEEQITIILERTQRKRLMKATRLRTLIFHFIYLIPIKDPYITLNSVALACYSKSKKLVFDRRCCFKQSIGQGKSFPSVYLFFFFSFSSLLQAFQYGFQTSCKRTHRFNSLFR